VHPPIRLRDKSKAFKSLAYNRLVWQISRLESLLNG